MGMISRTINPNLQLIFNKSIEAPMIKTMDETMETIA